VAAEAQLMTLQQAMQIAIGHHEAGRLAEAEGIYRQILAERPGHADALHLLGLLASQVGQADAGIGLIRQAIAIDPTVAVYHSNLGNTLWGAGRLDDARAALERAVQLRPDMAEAHNNLGNVLKDLGRLDEARAALERAVQLRPDLAEIHNNLGLVWTNQGKLEAAQAALELALRIKPDYAEAHNNFGNLLKETGRLDEAIASLERAVQLRPQFAEAHSNLGNALWSRGRLDDTTAALERAIALRPDLAEAHNSLGHVLKEQGRLDEALSSYRRAAGLKPGLTKLASNLLFALHFHPDYDAQAILAEHRQWAREFAEPLSSGVRPHDNDRAPERRLKIGFLSPDFRDHPVGRAVLLMFAHHDLLRFEFVGYSDIIASDPVTRELESTADQWHRIVGLADEQVADRIRRDRIDILVDLALHTGNSRPLVFARKPAPVQVSMIGMPATTGLSTMDYRLTDPYLDPPGTSDGDYTERSIRLPHCWWCYPAPVDAPTVSELPAAQRGFVTLGCLNQFAKVSRVTLEAWVRILRALPTARLVVQSQPGSHLDAVRTLFHDGGIAGARVLFVPPVGKHPYFQRYHDFDLCLDPFPYSGHITTADALWMGCPVITLAGRTAVGRGGVSVLSNIGLPGLIASSRAQYVATAVEWAGNLRRLAKVRSELRDQMRSSPLMDGKRFAADVEDALRAMWKSWCG
jgi:predicted O-linked N-acetylglucosamine transferase (SPINDLY family)